MSPHNDGARPGDSHPNQATRVMSVGGDGLSESGGLERISASVWWLATVLAFGAVMSGLDASVVNVGLDTIGRDLDASLVAVQWISSGYLLALAAALPACGWLSRRVGSGRLWLGSLAAFTVASGLCAVAPDVGLLIAFRALQGLAGGLLIPTGMTVLGQVVGPGRMGRVIATSSVPAILAPAVGPVVGAVLIANLSWHWLFLINLPIGVLGLVLGLRTVPRGDRVKGDRIDLPALLLVAAALPLVIFAITEAAELRTVLDPVVLVSLIAGLVALSVFVRRSLRSATPLLDLRLVNNRVYAAAAFAVFFVGAALFGGLIVMPLYFQIQQERTIVESGLLLMAFSIGAAATFPIAGRLADRYGGGIVTVAGLLVTAVSTVPFALLPADANLFTVETLQVLRGIGLALAGTPTISAAFATVRRDQLPDATSQINILSRVGGALGSAVFVVILTNQIPAGAEGASTADAFHTTFWWLTAAAIAALLGAGWLMREQRRLVPEGHPLRND
jgi:EmrB/QacA subfamily drug resistance transporter